MAVGVSGRFEFLNGTGYAVGDGYQTVGLPYQGSVSLVLVVPAAGRLAEVERGLGAGRLGGVLGGVLSGLPAREVQLTLPRFRYRAPSLALKEALTGLGITDLFLPGTADLSGMDGTRDLFVSSGHHQATVVVDEAGTEAAAATGMVVGIVSAPAEPPVAVVVDRPFLLAIRDGQTGTILFLGRVVDPR